MTGGDTDMRVEYLEDEESEHHYLCDLLGGFNAHFKIYYDHRYGRQKCEIQQYFSDVEQNLQELIDQRGSFNIN